MVCGQNLDRKGVSGRGSRNVGGEKLLQTPPAVSCVPCTGSIVRRTGEIIGKQEQEKSGGAGSCRSPLRPGAAEMTALHQQEEYGDEDEDMNR